MKRPASRSGARISGISRVSGPSGRSGVNPANRHKVADPLSLGNQDIRDRTKLTARTMFLAYVTASMRATSRKPHGTNAPLEGTGSKEIGKIEASQTFKSMKRCECTPVLDSSSLKLYRILSPCACPSKQRCVLFTQSCFVHCFGNLVS